MCLVITSMSKSQALLARTSSSIRIGISVSIYKTTTGTMQHWTFELPELGLLKEPRMAVQTVDD
jgi:hypothetical protein